MNLPSAENAVVDPEKVRDYLLSPTHPIGRFKAIFFGGVLGYTQSEWEELARDLIRIASQNPVIQGKFSRFGNKYEIHASLTGPSGRLAQVITVWIVRHGEQVPRFVTAVPGDAK